MSALSDGLAKMCKANRDGSHATQNNRLRSLLKIAKDLEKECGYKLPSPHSLKPKHPADLVKLYIRDGVSDRTIANRLAHIRWWASKVNKEKMLPIKNASYGIGGSTPKTDRAKPLNYDKLSKVSCPLVQASLQLQAAFGLRREEAIKFHPSWADKGGVIQLKGSWCKGGREREIPITHPRQRKILDQIHKLVGEGHLIPKGKNYIEQLKTYEHQTIKAGLRNNHGLRHQWAQWRYSQLTGWKCPNDGGQPYEALNTKQKRKDRQARIRISREMGHDRIAITRTYLG